MEFLFLVVGIVVGGGAVWFVMKTKIDSQETFAIPSTNFTEEDFLQLGQEKARLEERGQLLTQETQSLKEELNQSREANFKLNGEYEKEKSINTSLQDRLDEQKEELSQLNDKFNKEFENVAAKVLRINNEEMMKGNEQNLKQFLKPLGDRIRSFEEKMDESGKDRAGLKDQIKLLHDLNQKMANEAQNLTKALKGDAKKQGNWGEVILERVLERSGLVKGQEYDTQYSDNNHSGDTIRPDVIIKLPQNKHLIVDAKVSLVAYERFVNAESDEVRMQAIKEHLLSVKTHIKGLSDKAYQTANQLNTPDFVLLFIPIEASFSLAIQADIDLFNFAWDNKIVIVSPSTLLATLRTIASIWNQERQTKNALEIARQSGALYDKFVGFISDMEKINKNLNTTQKSYDDAMNKLSSGSGNLVRRAEAIKKLGAKASKEIDINLIEKAEGTNLGEENQQDDNE